MKIVQINTADLKPAEYNPRALTDEEGKDLQASLDRFGMVEPIVVNSAAKRKNVIIGGHQRYNLLKKQGEKTIPAVYVSIKDIAKEKELNLRLNKNLGHWDYDKLANFDYDALEMVGFDNLDDIFNFQEAEFEQELVTDAIYGEHLLVDFSGCEKIPTTAEAYYEILDRVINLNGLTTLKKTHFKFEPYGLTVVYIIGESHMAVSDYAEKKSIAFDLYSCKELPKTKETISLLKQAFKSKEVKINKVARIGI